MAALLMTHEPWFSDPPVAELGSSPFVGDQVIARLRDHLKHVAAVDWDYFALLRFRDEGRQAVSDLERLIYHARAARSQASPE